MPNSVTLMGVRHALLGSLACGLLLGAGSARADIYAFTDEQGVVHYTNVPNDIRYTLFMRTPQSAPAVSAGGGLKSGVRRAERYAHLIDAAARESSIEPELVRAVMVAESGADPHALSPKGARGLMQLMPDTARRYGVRNIYDPEQNIRGGAQYLSDLSNRYSHDLRLVLAAYNAGPNAVDQHGGRVPPIRETLDYVPRVLSLYHQFRQLTASP